MHLHRTHLHRHQHRHQHRHRLAGGDAGFLLVESDTQTSTCVDLVVLGPGPDGPLARGDLVARLGERLDRTPALWRRLEQVPLGLGHPLLVDDPAFRLDDHVEEATLAQPGGARELDDLVAEVLPRRLPLDRPLWRVTLVHGLAEGRQALLFQFHHALADGAALAGTLAQLLDDRVAATASSPGPAAPAPPRGRLLLATLGEQLLAWLALPLLLVRTVRRFRAVDRRRAEAPVRVPRPMGDAPRTALNRSAVAHRDFARTSLALADVRRARQATGTTLSDVLLAVVAGALREHLRDREELPERPLVVNVPLGDDRPGDEGRLVGNRFANYLAELATDEPDPRRRLAAIAAATAEARLQLEVLGRGTLTAWLDRMPPALAAPAARRMAERKRTGRVAPDFNLVVSNMRVPAGPWTAWGRPVEELLMSGPVEDGVGLNVTVTGYADRLGIALVVSPTAVDAPAELASRMHDALAELMVAHGCASEVA